MLAVKAVLGAVAAALTAARFFFSRTAKRRQDELEQLVRRVIARARQSIGQT